MTASARRLVLPVLLLAGALQCGPAGIEYSAERDEEAMERIERVWFGTVGEGPISISVCEDKAANDQLEEGGCDVDHVVKGGGRGTTRTADQAGGVGCGGCSLSALTNVVAIVHMPDGNSAVMRGTVRLGSAYEENPYTGDWGLWLATPEGYEGKAVQIEGRILEDGKLLLDGGRLNQAGFSKGFDNVELPAGIAASCDDE